MNAAKRRIVITGMGCVTPLGSGNDTFYKALEAGKSGISRLAAFEGYGEAQLAAEVRDFEPARYVKQRKSLKVMARDIQLAVGAAHLAWLDSGLEVGKVDPTRFGVSCGAGLIASDLEELGPAVEHSLNSGRSFDLKKWGAEGMEQLFPLWMLKYLPNMPACHISIFYDAQGPNNSVTAGEASSTLAMGEAFRIMMRGTADLFLAGGSDSKIHPLSFIRLALLGRLSRHFNDDPEKASRPFDRQRDGVVPGEAAALFTFEELGHARKRDATIYGEILGFGAACQPRQVRGAVERSIRLALADAGLTPGQLGHVVANGSSGVREDKEEAWGLAAALGDTVKTVPVVAYKSYLGHMAAGAGAVELAASLLALKHERLPPTLNYLEHDPEVPALHILSEPIPFPNKPFLLLGQSYGGQCGALVVQPYKE